MVVVLKIHLSVAISKIGGPGLGKISYLCAMGLINRFIYTISALAFVALVVALNVFMGLYFISLAVVPATWVYALATGQSYHFVIDQSAMLYRVNKFGQWAWLITACLAVSYLVFWKNL